MAAAAILDFIFEKSFFMKGRMRYTEFLRSAVPFDDDWSFKCMVKRFLQAICFGFA